MDKEKLLFLSFLYVGLIVSAALSTIPIISLIALPVFILSTIFCIVITLGLTSKEQNKKNLTNILFIIGFLLLASTVAYTADKTAEFFLKVPKVYIYGKQMMNLEAAPLPMSDILKSVAVAIAGALFITLGIKERINLSRKNLLFILILTSFSSLLTIAVITILAIVDLPFGA